MHTLTTDELARQPQRLLDQAARGGASLVTRGGEPVLLAVPLGQGAPVQTMLDALSANSTMGGLISLGRAARIAGLAYSETIDEFARRGIDTVRLTPEELERELAAFRS